MTAVASKVLYSRPDGALWRDTGRHVVVLASDGSSQVKVLGGGGALVWRLLERPCSTDDLLLALASLGGQPPTTSDLEACLDDLTGQGLIACETT